MGFSFFYQLAFLTPGNKPSLAIFLKQTLQIPKSLYTDFGLPQIEHLVYALEENLGFLLALAIIDFFAIMLSL
jgi:hypothetical protein